MPKKKGPTIPGPDRGGTKEDLTKKDVRAIKELLHNSWVDIGYKYDGLTENEKKVIDRKTFERLNKWIGD